MGRLTRPHIRRKRLGQIGKVSARWVLPLGLSLAIIFGFNTFARADTPPTPSELATYLETNELNVSVESIDGYQQVFYLYNGDKIQLTFAPYSHTNPIVSGEYVAWQGLVNGASQVYVYDVLTHSLTQLTSFGTNQNPSLYGNLVMWESWTGDRWQLFYNDGYSSYELTSGANSAVRPRSNGQQIVFAQQEADGWKAYSFDILSGQYSVVKQGAEEEDTAFPKFTKDGNITTDIGNYYRDN